jgi:hypothetical protein
VKPLVGSEHQLECKHPPLMTADGHWHQLDELCRNCIARLVDVHDAIGDGPAVNALCQYARKRFGPGLRW